MTIGAFFTSYGVYPGILSTYFKMGPGILLPHEKSISSDMLQLWKYIRKHRAYGIDMSVK